jgi:N-acetylglutamate synthase-like GNAT family acetyltransferase
VIIRIASVSDAAAIHHVRIAAIRSLARSHYSTEEIEAWCGHRSAASFLEPIERKLVIVAANSDGINGFAQLDASTQMIGAVYVAPGAAHRGIGGRLLAEMEAHAKAAGISELRLESSLNAVAFYAQAGYSLVREANHAFDTGACVSCINMRKVLTANAGA